MDQVQKKYFLYPSMLFVNKEQYLVQTILGSCVSVCLFDETLQIGGINHYMLPVWNGTGLASPKYGNIAIEKLADKLWDMGAVNLVAKVFGGACSMQGSMKVGERNIEVAREQLGYLGIDIVAENVGGTVGRKIYFDTKTGKVLMKFLSG